MVVEELFQMSDPTSPTHAGSNIFPQCIPHIDVQQKENTTNLILTYKGVELGGRE